MMNAQKLTPLTAWIPAESNGMRYIYTPLNINHDATLLVTKTKTDGYHVMSANVYVDESDPHSIEIEDVIGLITQADEADVMEFIQTFYGIGITEEDISRLRDA